MAKSRLKYPFSLLCVAALCALGCQNKSDASADIPITESDVPKPAPNWFGLPLVPGLPVALDTLVLGGDVKSLQAQHPAALTPEGMSLSHQTSARVVTSKSGSIRYLIVSAKMSAQEVLNKWPGATEGPVDFRGSRSVWLLPTKRMQIHLSTSDTGCELTYVPLTSLTMLVGPPTGTGLTFGSYIGKPLSAISPMFARLSNPKADRSRFGWAHPLRFETVSLKANIKVASDGEEIETINLFLKDDLTGSLRTAIQAEASKHWTKTPDKKGYIQSGVMMRMTQIPQLGLRKRTHKNLTLSFSKSLDTNVTKGVPLKGIPASKTESDTR